MNFNYLDDKSWYDSLNRFYVSMYIRIYLINLYIFIEPVWRNTSLQQV